MTSVDVYEDRDGAPWPPVVQTAAADVQGAMDDSVYSTYLGATAVERGLDVNRGQLSRLILAVESAVLEHVRTVVGEETTVRTDALSHPAPGWSASTCSARINEAILLHERICHRMGWPL